MTNDEAFTALERQLRDTPPISLRELAPIDLDDLTEAVRAVRHRQAAELAAAGEHAFGHIPWLLRGPIKKLLS